MRIRKNRSRGIVDLSKDKEDKSKVKLPESFLGKIVSLFFVSLIIFMLVLFTKYF